MFALSLTELLYYLACALLSGMAVFVLVRSPQSARNRYFALTALSLLVWIATLFLFDKARDPLFVLHLGRANFAAIVFALFFGYLFVRALAIPPLSPLPRQRYQLLLGETLLLGLLSAFTPLVDRAEIVATAASGGAHTTVYGPLFPLYLLHVFGYLGATLLLALRGRNEVRQPERDQLLLVGLGTLATGLISIVTNAVLPYGLGDFRYIHVGPLSSILFLMSVAYAIVRHRLFSIRLLIRKTLIYGLLLSFVLAAYSAVVVLVTDHLAGQSASALTRFSVLVIAFSFDPLRRFLEKSVDRLLFEKGQQRRQRRQQRSPIRQSA